ncbi:zinc finger domain-containing protein [Streptomyces puniciscabiei]|uniref:zinc finger domain-containing protein n=1 Tax=Streptomyces puniciscabiei TaxID=164348 RepID=UPI003EBB9324
MRSVACPQCGAGAGQPFRTAPDGTSRYVNHQRRVTAFLAARDSSVPGPQVGGQRRLQPPREYVRTVPCPRCSAPAHAPCTGAGERNALLITSNASQPSLPHTERAWRAQEVRVGSTL